jgi:hypothetical protein
MVLFAVLQVRGVPRAPLLPPSFPIPLQQVFLNVAVTESLSVNLFDSWSYKVHFSQISYYQLFAATTG